MKTPTVNDVNDLLNRLRMKIKTISYKRYQNLEYNSNECLEMSAELDEGEDPIEAAKKLKETVLISLGLLLS